MAVETGFQTRDATRALATGLTIRSPRETAQDTLAWLVTRPPDHKWLAGITAERERKLLAFYGDRTSRRSAIPTRLSDEAHPSTGSG